MSNVKISDTIKYIGVNDKEIDLFESQYDVPNGVSYNSYLIRDEKIAIMDTVDVRKVDEWLLIMEKELAGATPDYLVCLHMEPDHGGSSKIIMEKYPEMKVVGNAKTFAMIDQFFDVKLDDRKIIVKEGDTLSLGSATLHFMMAPMIHWPEVMVAYEEVEKVLFSADAFGKFGALDVEGPWACEARRYYFNIVGKYGAQVQGLLKKVAPLELKTICPLHGPVLTEELDYYIGKYDVWSRYEPEDKGIFIAYASIHGNTKAAAEKLKEMLEERSNEKVSIADLCREDMHEAIEDAFRYDRLVLASSSYDGGVFPPMEDFLHHLKAKNYQKRTIAIIENGSWAPSAARTMKGIIEGMKAIELCENVVTIKSTLKEDSLSLMSALADELLGK